MIPRYALLLIGLILIVGMVSADTAIIFASNDVSVSQSTTNSSWDYLRTSPGNGVANNPTLPFMIRSDAGSFQPNLNRMYRYGNVFDTSFFAGKTITSGIVRLKYNGKSTTYGGQNESALVGGSPTNPAVWVAGDYDSFGTTEYAPRFDFTTITSGDVNFTLTAAGLAHINTSGDTVFMMMDGDELDGVFTGTWGSSASRYLRVVGVSDATESNRPYAVFEYTTGGGDTTPPASLSGFANTTSCSGTNISFSKPGDADYNGFEVWWNNVAESNQTNATTWYNKSGLSESTTYTLSTKTFDLTGNVNGTFQNYSITTGACGTAPVAAFSASNTTMCAGNVTRFTDASTNTPTSWYWEFGDGNTSTTQNPLVQYDVIGLKTVNLKATNAYGFDWENKTGYINVTTCAAPTPTPTPTPTTVPPTTAPTSPPTYSNLWCGIQNGYFQDIPSGVDGFRDLHNYASGNPLVDENVTITDASGVVFIDSYISPPGALTGVKLLEGLRNYNIYGYVSSVSQPSYFTFNVSKYDTATNTEVFFYNLTSVPISSVTPTLDKTYFTSPKNVSFSATERILIRIGAYTTRNTATTIHFLNQGTTPTYVQSGYFQCPVVSGAASNTDYGFAICALAAVIFGMLGALVLIRRKQ